MRPLALLLLAALLAPRRAGSWQCGAARRRGLRRAQEDFTLLAEVPLPAATRCPPLQLAALFDGHEGGAAAAFARRELPAAAASQLTADSGACDAAARAWRGDALAAALRRALADVDSAFLAAAAASAPPLRDGATALAALLPRGVPEAAVAHIGDSRAFACGAAARPLTTADHSPDAPAERARIAAAGGVVARGRLQGELAVARALGDAPYRRFGLVSDADAAAHALRPGARLLLLSDGALEGATAAQLCDVASGGASARRDIAAAAAARARAVIALRPAAAEPPQPPAAHAASLAGAADDDAAFGPLADAAAATADAALQAGSTDNVAAIVCAAPGDAEEAAERADGDAVGDADGDAAASLAAPGAVLAGRWLLVAPAPVLRGPYAAADVALFEAEAASDALVGTSASPWAVAARRECAALPSDASAAAPALYGFDAAAMLALGEGDAACVLALLALPAGRAAHAPASEADAPPAAPDAPDAPVLGGGRFRLSTAAGHGHFGEVWHAVRAPRDGNSSLVEESAFDDPRLRFVLKRAPASAGAAARAAAAREAHFGAALRGAAHAARFVHAFPGGARDGDTWLAFVDEGVSLDALMYGGAGGDGGAAQQQPPGGAGSLAVLAPSAWWRERRRSAAGAAQLRALLRGVLAALAEAHGRGVAHRDVKPGNVLVSRDDAAVRLCDWGSAVDAAALSGGLYGAAGPSAAEETPGYAPPEARFGGAAWPGRNATPQLFAYDVWSAGVLGLELLALGTPDVFAPPPRAAAAAARDAAAAGLGGAAADALSHLRALAALCIAPPAPQAGPAQARHPLAPSADACSDGALAAALRARDPAARAGAPPLSRWALRLLRALLAWDPAARPSAARALQHAFFSGDDPAGRGFDCADGTQADWADGCAEQLAR